MEEAAPRYMHGHNANSSNCELSVEYRLKKRGLTVGLLATEALGVVLQVLAYLRQVLL